MGLHDQINKLETQLKDIENQISEIRKTCKHEDKKPTMRPGGAGFAIMIMCSNCGIAIRPASPTEQQDFLKS